MYGLCVQIKEIVKLAPRKRQTLLFSATMTEQVQQLITMSLKQPVRLAADAAGRAPEELRQEIVRLKVCHDCFLGLFAVQGSSVALPNTNIIGLVKYAPPRSDVRK